MPNDDRPAVIPSAVDPAYECVRVDGEPPAAPPGPAAGPPDEPAAPPLCPPGYVPRLRPRPGYRLRGKEVVSDDPPEENPGPR